MKILDPGHQYSLNVLDDPYSDREVILTFVKRCGKGYPGNKGYHPGTTTQDVLRALIDRTLYVDNQIHDSRNDNLIYHLRRSLLELELRAAERHGRRLQLLEISGIENQPFCLKCGHIGCDGTCHET